MKCIAYSLTALCITIILSPDSNAYLGARMLKKKSVSDPCATSPTIGTVCLGGAIYAGNYSGSDYMITQSNCAEIPAGQKLGSGNNAYPSGVFIGTCSGGTDTLIRTWNDGSGNYYDIPGVETVASAATKSSSSYKGDVNTPVIATITASGQGGYHAASLYCQHLNFGGFTDWYLPSKSEMTYIYCKSRTSGGASYPEEDPNCATYGYGVAANLIPGFNTTGSGSGFYYTSTEFAANGAWYISFANGRSQNGFTKATGYLIRCIRRY